MGEKGIWLSEDILGDESLTISDCVIAGCIRSLDKDGGCFANNAYLAKLCHCSERTVSSSIARLSEKGYVEQLLNGKRRTLHYNHAKIARMPSNPEKNSTDHAKFAKDGGKFCEDTTQNLRGQEVITHTKGIITDDNTSYNTFYNTIYNKTDNERDIFTREEVKDFFAAEHPTLDSDRFFDEFHSRGWTYPDGREFDCLKDAANEWAVQQGRTALSGFQRND